MMEDPLPPYKTSTTETISSMHAVTNTQIRTSSSIRSTAWVRYVWHEYKHPKRLNTVWSEIRLKPDMLLALVAVLIRCCSLL